MPQAFAFDGVEWQKIKAAYAFHHGIGFVKLNSVRVHDGTNWLTVELPDGSFTIAQYRDELVDA